MSSPLALLHPRGYAEHVQVIGDNCPRGLMPVSASADGGPLDLVIVAPTSRQWRLPGWREDLSRVLQSQLAQDGLVYVIAGPGVRRGLRMQLTGRHPFAAGVPWLHFSSPRTQDHHTLVAAPALRDALTGILPNPPWKRRLGTAATRYELVQQAFVSAWPSVGFAVRRASGPPVLEWLLQYETGPESHERAILTTTTRKGSGSVVVQVLGSSGHTGVVAKLTRGPATTCEAANLRRLGPRAALGGTRVPDLLAEVGLGGQPVTVQTRLAGRSVSGLLQTSPGQATMIMERAAGWLQQWNVSTRRDVRFNRGVLEPWLLAPLNRLRPYLRGGHAYSEWVAERCGDLSVDGPIVDAHLDLTTWNMVVQETSLGIYDWEEAQPDALPLVDFFYAMADIVGVARRLAPARALEECVAPSGAYFPSIRALLRKLRSALRIPDELVDLCLHACFVGHAANELDRLSPGQVAPFHDAVQWLAFNHETIRRWLLE
jgi:hypothetical protein